MSSEQRVLLKISDFGLSRITGRAEAQGPEYYRMSRTQSEKYTQVPVWAAPEALCGKYTEASDVWSFGNVHIMAACELSRLEAVHCGLVREMRQN
jgi:serine/threonine protein kinase